MNTPQADKFVSLSNPVTSSVSSKKAQIASKDLALWHLIGPQEISLTLLNMDTQKEETIFVNMALSKISLEPGHWQIVGFKIQNENFKILNTSERFVFRVKKKAVSYVGSLVVQCPKVSPEYNSELKTLSFFNRYYYSSENGLCEMIVGNKFAAVKKSYKEIEKKSKLSVVQGF